MTDSQTPPRPLAGAAHSGQVLAGRYRLVTLLARGGMADVWEGTDTLLQRPVAIKVLHPHLAADDGFVHRFRTEAVAAARLHHAAIVSIYDTCSDHGIEAIVMELVQGPTLREELDTRGPMPPARAAAIGARVAGALAAAHRAGVVHRDVKPANILLADDDRVLVTDFGIAKLHGGGDPTDTGTMLGSAKYLAPEQVEGGAVDGRCDVYALGAVLYESVTGHAPFTGDTPAAVAVARLHVTPTPPRQLRPEIPVDLDQAIMRALARDRDDRFADATAMATALTATNGSTATVRADPDATLVEPRPATAATALATSGAAVAPAYTVTYSGAPEPQPNESPASTRRRSRRLVAAVIVLTLVGAALVTTGILLTRTQGGQDVMGSVAGTPQAAGGAIAVRSVTPFDPSGDGREGNDTAALAIDGDAETGWRTEMYDTRNFGNLKSGAGIVIALDRRAALGSLRLSSPTRDWAAQVYVADAPGTDLASWGQPVAQATGIDGDASFDLHGAAGRDVLVWVTDLGGGPPRVFTQIDEIGVTAA